MSWVFTINSCKRCTEQKCKYKGRYIDAIELQIPLFQSTISFKGEGDELGDSIGDVIFQIIPKEHEFFKIHHNHLVIEKKISLYEWLYGINFRIRHLNGQIIRIYQNKHLRYPVYQMKGLGMPPNENFPEQGDLLIRLQLDFSTIDRELMYKICPPINVNEKFKPSDDMITEHREDLLPLMTEEMDSLNINMESKSSSDDETKSIEIVGKKNSKKK
jgi:DnaJ-class molecular chaperone